MQHGPVAIATASLIAGALFALVTSRTVGRSKRTSDPAAHLALACAWGGFAFMALSDAARILIGTYQASWFPAYTGLAILKIVAGGVTIWGLGVYVAQAWLGDARAWRWHLGAYAAAHTMFFLYAYKVRHASAAVAGEWVPRLVFDGPPVLPAPLGVVALALYFVPPLVLVVLFAAYGRSLTDAAARNRIRTTTIAMATFQVANMYQSNPDIPGDSLLFPLLSGLTLLAGILAHLAHRPGGLHRARTAIATTHTEPGLDLEPSVAPLSSSNPGDTLK